MVQTNRRLSPRQGTKGTIQVFLTPEASENDRQPSELIQVKLGNQSRDGIYIETDRSLEPGANVSIKMVSPEEDRPESAYLLRDGRVVWCQKVNGGNHRFGAGIKILRKVVQADVLTSRFR
ncbi:MAG: PilZ domain-containing protein [Deltaproteobacteria bacterium]|jgi:Tfp pilus assembly protein PilZ|nr:PilZ domain-containing protein [Deltaproteobacteria bacterium]